jgi:endonuclease/exonuclease/phosphatase family metal-dependent hydrolase
MNFLSLLLTLFTVVELNCENLFDCQHDSAKNDYEFLPTSEHKWTPSKYWRKLNNISKEILSCTCDSMGHERLPDLVVMCEVENDSVMRDLTKRSLLRGGRYEYVMTHSADERGIDVALLYQPFSFRLIKSFSIRPEPFGSHAPTRDILYVEGQIMSGDTVHLFAVHMPSRIGGETLSFPFRRHVAQTLRHAVDSLDAVNRNSKILIAGDFNDYASDSVLAITAGDDLTNISAGRGGSHGAKATYRYNGQWNSLDHIVVSDWFVGHLKNCRVNDIPFLLTDDKKYGGKKPHRTFLGYKFDNGYSDHLPLVADFEFFQ